MEIPDFLRRYLIDEYCPSHNKQLYLMGGRKMCPECQSIRADKQYQEKIKDNMDPDRLERFNKEKYAKNKGQSTLEGSAGDVIKKVMGGKE